MKHIRLNIIVDHLITNSKIFFTFEKFDSDMRFKFILFLFVFSSSLFAQNQVKIDSLTILLNNVNADTLKIKILTEIANQYARFNYIKAVEFSKQALEIAQKTDNKKTISYSYSVLGNNLLFLGNYDEALNYYLESLKLTEDINDEVLRFQIYHNLGVLKDRLQQFDEALEFYFKALGLFEKNVANGVFKKIENQYPVIFNSIGNIYETKKDYKTSEEYYLKGYNLAINKNYEIFGVITNNLGKLEIEMGNYDKAFQFLNQSLEFRKKINDQHGIAKTYIFLALYYKELKDYNKALDFANQALKISQETNTLLTYQNAASILSEIYELVPNYKKALEYYKLYKELNDSLINDKKYNELARIQLKYEYEIENREKVAKEQRIRFRLILTSSTLLLGLIILGLLFILSRSRNKRIQLEKDKLEKDMMLKNKELTTNVLYLLKKNELIDNITTRLLKLKERLKEENTEHLQKIIIDLQSITDNEVWEEFELRFQNVHEEFYKNLQSKFPDLSPAEIKLAAFLRLNMTTKDIASITGQSINSLETARYRLRKKLGITNQEVNLVNFLLNL